MAKLGKLIIPRQEIPFGDDVFYVRGINLNDILHLMINHAPAMNRVYGLVTEQLSAPGKGSITEGTVRDIAMKAMHEFPEFIFSLIAAAADDLSDSAIENARSLPITTQLEAMLAILHLSLKTESDLKKFAAVIIGLVEWAAMAMETAKTAVEEATGTGMLPGGYGESAEQ